MGLISEILKRMDGQLEVSFSIDDSHVVDVLLDKKTVKLDVKNPLTLLELGLSELIKSKKEGSIFKRLKDKGFEVKIKYAGFEVDL